MVSYAHRKLDTAISTGFECVRGHLKQGREGTPPASARSRASGSQEPPARGEEFRSLATAGGDLHCRRWETAGMGSEPALAPGWALGLGALLGQGCSGARANFPNHTTSSWPLTCSAGSEEVTGQKPHWPGSRSCLQRSSMAMDPTERLSCWEDHPVTSRSHRLEPEKGDE